MLKKRIVFTLLYDSGHFMLSRNFKLQRVGDLKWLQRNYDFSKVSQFIDELVVLDVTRENRDSEQFCSMLSELASTCYVPIAAGGGITSRVCVRQLLLSGADKVVVNSLYYNDASIVKKLIQDFGQQSIVASVDVKKDEGLGYCVFSSNGQKRIELSLKQALMSIATFGVGEIYLTSIDRDGSGQGYELSMLDHLPVEFPIPIILSGGVGNSDHLLDGLRDNRVDAVSTANLFNFVGDGLARARMNIVSSGVVLPSWLPFEQIDIY